MARKQDVCGKTVAEKTREMSINQNPKDVGFDATAKADHEEAS